MRAVEPSYVPQLTGRKGHFFEQPRSSTLHRHPPWQYHVSCRPGGLAEVSSPLTPCVDRSMTDSRCRYDTPAAFKPSATLPSPTLLNPLLHILRLVVSPFPQGLLVRTLPISDAPSLSIKGGSAAFWENAASSLASVGRWKRMPTLGAEEKVGYLAFKAKGGR